MKNAPKIHNVVYVTRDMDRAQAFYEKALGLQVKFRDGSRWAQLTAGSMNFSLSSPDESPRGVEGATVVFEVDSIARKKDMIVSNGGTILSERDMGAHGKTLSFVDPTGNVGQLLQKTATISDAVVQNSSVDAESFKRVMRQHASTVVLILVDGGAGVAGLPVTAFTPLSLDPALVLFCINRDSQTHSRLVKDATIGISFLSQGQEDISNYYATRSRKDVGEPPVTFERSANGAPLVPAACGAMEAVITNSYPGGDHTIFVAQVSWAADRADRTPLLFHNRAYTAPAL